MKYFLLLTLLLAACTTTQNLPVQDRSRVYDTEYEDVFDATVQMLAEQGFAIIDAEKDEGIINTDYRVESNIWSFFTGPTRMKVSALISNASSGTQVLLNFDLQEADTSGDAPGVYNSTSLTPRAARRYYQEFFSSLDDYVARY